MAGWPSLTSCRVQRPTCRRACRRTAPGRQRAEASSEREVGAALTRADDVHMEYEQSAGRAVSGAVPQTVGGKIAVAFLLTAFRGSTTISASLTTCSARGRPVHADRRTDGRIGEGVDPFGQITFTQGDMLLKDKIHSLSIRVKRRSVNLANVSYVDSAGLGQLVGAYNTVAQAGGSMKLVSLTKKMHDLLTITKLLTVFEVFESEQEALKRFD